MNRFTLLLSLTLPAVACAERVDKPRPSRSDAVASTSQEMSGPSFFSHERLAPALALLQTKAGRKVLRLEIGPREVVMQAEDPSSAGSVVELHYRDGRVSEAEHATLRGKGQLADNLFSLEDVKLASLAELARVAVERVDPESGAVEQVLIRRNLPESDEVRLRVYVKSPRQSGYVDADRNLTPL